jgi:hypothetical protein
MTNQCAAWVLDNPILSLQDTTENPVGKLLTVDRLSAYPALEEATVPVMAIYDSRQSASDQISALKKVIPDVKICEVAGKRTRGEFESTDWESWQQCMSELFSRLKSPEKPLPVTSRKLPNKNKREHNGSTQ